jgi:hypothetical protein
VRFFPDASGSMQATNQRPLPLLATSILADGAAYDGVARAEIHAAYRFGLVESSREQLWAKGCL